MPSAVRCYPVRSWLLANITCSHCAVDALPQGRIRIEVRLSSQKTVANAGNVGDMSMELLDRPLARERAATITEPLRTLATSSPHLAERSTRQAEYVSQHAVSATNNCQVMGNENRKSSKSSSVISRLGLISPIYAVFDSTGNRRLAPSCELPKVSGPLHPRTGPPLLAAGKNGPSTSLFRRMVFLLRAMVASYVVSSRCGNACRVEKILRRLGQNCRFSVIDGAQAFNQRPVDLSRLPNVTCIWQEPKSGSVPIIRFESRSSVAVRRSTSLTSVRKMTLPSWTRSIISATP